LEETAVKPDIQFAQPEFLWILLAAVPAMIGLFYWSWRVKQKLLRQFVGSRLLGNLLIGVSPRRQAFRFALLVAAVAGILIALSRPQWGFAWEEAKQKGLDIIVAVDTSRSMLAQDVAPDRLERAKLAVLDLMKDAKSDRLGLVAFAGAAFLQTPLTLDDQAFRQGVEALNVGIVPQGGTSLSSAIRTSLAAFEKGEDNHKVLVLFTDGEDHDVDTETMAAAKEAADAGMHIFTIGVGTPAGELLRVKDDQGNYSFIKDDEGNVVKSHLNESLLRQIATVANGFYLPLQGADPMATLYARGLAPLPKTEATTRLTRVYKERYHWFLAFAVICLLLEFLLPESSRSRRSESSARRRTALQQSVAVICFVLLSITARASPSGAFNDYQSGDFKAAFDEYNRLAEQKTNDYRLHYDAGEAAYRAKQLEKAEKQFNDTLASPTVAPDLQTQEHTYYDLGNTEYRLGEPLPDPDKKEERWNHAIDSYIQALRLNTNDIEAKNNLAFVKEKLEQLKQQQQQQQKQKNQKNQKNNKNQQQQQNQQNQQNQEQKDQQEQQQQESAKQDQKNGQGQSEQEKQKEEEQRKQQQEQAQKDKEQQQQQAQSKPGEEKSQEEAQQAAAGQMTPQEARQLLSEQKDDEKALIFSPENQPVTTQNGKIKDW
jgi:Ca-activated chloride channel family protein